MHVADSDIGQAEATWSSVIQHGLITLGLVAVCLFGQVFVMAGFMLQPPQGWVYRYAHYIAP